MRLTALTGRHAGILAARNAHPAAAVEPAEAAPAPAAGRLGTLHCSARGCHAQTGLSCSYRDHRGRACPTAWCPAHRAVLADSVLCPAHGHDGAVPTEVDDPVPLLVAWAAREVDGEIGGLVRRLCDEHGQTYVADPVHLALVGIDRVRTWERAWKMTSHLGITLRVQVCVEEARPDTLLAKVNAKVVACAAAPPPELLRLEERPETDEPAGAADCRSTLVEAVGRAVAGWRAQYDPPHPAVPAPAAGASPAGPVT